LLSSSSRLVIEIPSYRPTKQEESYDSSDTKDYNRKSARLKYKELISYKGLFIYNLAFIAYLGTLNKEANELSFPDVISN
jgi:hypothetical protein